MLEQLGGVLEPVVLGLELGFSQKRLPPSITGVRARLRLR